MASNKRRMWNSLTENQSFFISCGTFAAQVVQSPPGGALGYNTKKKIKTKCRAGQTLILTPDPHKYGEKHSSHIVKQVRLLRKEQDKHTVRRVWSKKTQPPFKHSTSWADSDSCRVAVPHPGGVACCIEFPVTALLVTQRTHDDVSSNRLVADFLAAGRKTGVDDNDNDGNKTPHFNAKQAIKEIVLCGKITSTRCHRT